MRGKNEIHINQATMRQAMQLWLDDQFKSAPKVTDVRRNTNGGQPTDQFIVVVDGVETALSKDQLIDLAMA